MTTRDARRADILRRVAALACGAALVWLTACRSDRGSETGRTSAPAAPDSLVFATLGDPETLDPAESADNNSDAVIFSIYETLLTFDRDMHIVGRLAERWSMGTDGVTWTFQLHRGVRFHDGTPLDATAVKQSLDRLRDPVAAHRNRSLCQAISDVRVVDPVTVEIVTAFPFSAFEPTLAHLATGIVSPTAAARWGKGYGRSAEAAVGSGAFRVVRWNKDRELMLERNDGYWGEKPRLRRVAYRPVPEAEAKVAALEAGDVDVIKAVAASALPRLCGNPTLAVYTVPSINSTLLKFNCGREPFKDSRLRRAVSYAVDRHEIVDHLFQGVAEVPKGPLGAVIRNGVPLAEIPYDPNKARQLLKEAGHPDGFKTTITTTKRYVMGVEVAEVLAAQLKRVGIDVSIEVEEAATFMGRSAATPAQDTRQMYITGLGASTADADWALRPRFTSSDPINTSFYKNAEFDRVVVQAMHESDPATRRALYKRAEEIVYLDDPPALWLYHNYAVVAARRKVRNLRLWPLNIVTFEQAYIEP